MGDITDGKEIAQSDVRKHPFLDVVAEMAETMTSDEIVDFVKALMNEKIEPTPKKKDVKIEQPETREIPTRHLGMEAIKSDARGPQLPAIDEGADKRAYDEYENARRPDDHSPGATHVSREPRPEVDDFVITDADVRDHLNADKQIKDFADPSAESQVYLNNAQKACAKCPGFCCLAFEMNFRPDEHEKRLEQKREELARHPDIKYVQEDVYMLEFFLGRLIPVTDQNSDRMYRCSAFDVVTRRCTEYETRPKLCKQYLCGPSTIGRVPALKTMAAGHSPSTMEIIRKQDIYQPSIEHEPSHLPALPEAAGIGRSGEALRGPSKAGVQGEVQGVVRIDHREPPTVDPG